MSLQTQNLHKVSEIPLSQIKRPIAPVLDEPKIDSMETTLKTNAELPPVDVLQMKNSKGSVVNFAFGGCHRLQAYDRLARATNGDPLVRCKILPATRQQLELYLGSSLAVIDDE
ncbi:hypothetical protein HG536_0G00430 [Torulaspora globosa]|uniref:Sulfiredoxin n=1 Tax=Torulaspora globosa TaxID=48254 RepID=A0A7G3ZL00_9SACH|nr:uncharacterized protein HG536_0G00430 [Torulaspora globosa]QLL34186.1 hypothetical protein HG536_0G00430 [Torulaspora globosa]